MKTSEIVTANHSIAHIKTSGYLQVFVDFCLPISMSLYVKGIVKFMMILEVILMKVLQSLHLSHFHFDDYLFTKIIKIVTGKY